VYEIIGDHKCEFRR